MTEQDKQRIEKEAREFAGGNYKKAHFPVHWDKAHSGYIAGATRENERMAELLKEQIELVSVREAEQDVMAVDTVRLMDQIEYQKKALKEDYDKITKLEFELKEERNKAIDECKNKVRNAVYIKLGDADKLINSLESLKSQ